MTMSQVHTFPSPPLPKSKRMPNGHASPHANGSPSSSSSRTEPTSPRSPLRNGHARRKSIESAKSEAMDLESESEDELDGPMRPIVHVEVRMKSSACTATHTIQNIVRQFIQSTVTLITPDTLLEDWEEIAILNDTVERIYIAESPSSQDQIDINEADLHIHVYKPSRHFGTADINAITEDDDDDDERERVPAASVRELPAADLDGLWENLIYADDIKSRLLNYIYSTTAFSDAEIDFNVVTWNRMVLLHGPPGTGKTSLCRALAQKLCIRLSDRYPTGKIVEINSHSLFSRWFSESGKLVQKLFSEVNKISDDEDCFVVVMIDEEERSHAANYWAQAAKESEKIARRAQKDEERAWRFAKMAGLVSCFEAAAIVTLVVSLLDLNSTCKKTNQSAATGPGV